MFFRMGHFDIDSLYKMSPRLVSNKVKTFPMPERSHISKVPAYMLAMIGLIKHILSMVPLEDSIYMRMYQTKVSLPSLALCNINQTEMMPHIVKKEKVRNHLSKQDHFPLGSIKTPSLKEVGNRPKNEAYFNGLPKLKRTLPVDIFS